MRSARLVVRRWCYSVGYKHLYARTHQLDRWLHLRGRHHTIVCDLHDVLNGMPWRLVLSERRKGPHRTTTREFESYLNHPSQQAPS